MYQPDEIDPSTIHIDHSSRVREFMDEARALAASEAQRLGCYIMVFHDEGQTIRVKAIARETFETAPLQCPRAADKAYEDETGTPRPVPSIVGLPDGSSVVSKPSLCNGCSWNLYRQTHGNCYGRKFDQLDLKG